MRMLVIGHGSMGARHASNAAALGCEVSVFEPDPLVGLPPQYRRLDDLHQGLSADAVVIASPASEHAGQLALFREHHVLVEKPIATNMEQVFGADLRSTADKVKAAGYSLRFHPGLRRMRELLPNVGQVRTARFVVRCDKSTWPGSNYCDMLLEASHEIDLALWMLGPAVLRGASGRGDTWTLLLQHDESGAASTVVLDGTYGSHWREAEISGPHGTLVHRWSDRLLDWRWSLSGPGAAWNEEGHANSDAMYFDEMSAFVSAINGGSRGGLCTFSEAIAVLRFCDAARRLQL